MNIGNIIFNWTHIAAALIIFIGFAFVSEAFFYMNLYTEGLISLGIGMWWFNERMKSVRWFPAYRKGMK